MSFLVTARSVSRAARCAVLFALSANAASAQLHAPDGSAPGLDGGGPAPEPGSPGADAASLPADAASLPADAAALHRLVPPTAPALSAPEPAPGPLPAPLPGVTQVAGTTPGGVGEGAAPTLDVTIVGSSKAQRTRESAAAVTVVELELAKRQAADLGEVLARMEGINVRRVGGLGSEARFSLNGLTDDQIRFLVDDVPLELAGFPQGFASMPWLMLDHVTVYRGVVPIRFGADALGGAMNLVSRQPTRGYGGEASYQIGSFGTHRAALSGFQVHRPTGLYTRMSLYVDSARNDYEVDAQVATDAGELTMRRVERFHDQYRAYGGSAELGVVKKPWAERLVLRMFGTKYDRDLQNNLIMTVPYGEARYQRASYGANLRYKQPLTSALRLEVVGGYAYQPTRFIDEAAFIYDWLGNRLRPDPNPGETSNKAIDQTFRQHSGFARALTTWRIAEGHELELALMPTYTQRTGEDHRLAADSRDPLSDVHRLLSIVSGLAYQLNAWDDLLDNSLFAKSYVYRTWADQTAPNGTKLKRDQEANRFGVGDALRIRITRSLYTKASYELATRLPRAEDVFGDGVLVNPNLELKPESSHNGNLELTLHHDTAHAGQLRASVNGFLRKVRDQIVLLGARREGSSALGDYRYQNVFAARSRGVETSAGWSAPGEYLALDVNATYIDLRNVSGRGTFGRYEGERIPNRPYLFANTSARGTLRSLLRSGDELTLFWYMRYVYKFQRFWGGDGLAGSKATIDSQRTHTLGLLYSLALEPFHVDAVLEVQNLTDATVVDNWGAQRPGRGYYFKLSGRR